MSATMSIVSPLGYSRSTCGYCSAAGQQSKAKTSRSYGMWAHDLSPEHYQALCDRGWRRSGRYVYKPDQERTCCKQITIRLKAGAFRFSHSHKRTIKRALLQLYAEDAAGEAIYRSVWGKGKGKGKYTEPTSLKSVFNAMQGQDQPTDAGLAASSDPARVGKQTMNLIHKTRQIQSMARRKQPTSDGLAAESACRHPPYSQGKRLAKRLLTSLVLAASSDEKYELFRQYQMQVHKESSENVSSRAGFERFLCDSSIRRQRPAQAAKSAVDSDGVPVAYGLYHMEWRLLECDSAKGHKDERGQLIAVGVLDILPSCLSSVYLFYDPKHRSLELGRLSALREILLTQQLNEMNVIQADWYYMGFYIFDCVKMRYKGEFKPSMLLDAQSNQWMPLEKAVGFIRSGYSYGWQESNRDTPKATSQFRAEQNETDTNSNDEQLLPEPAPPGVQNRSELSSSLVANLMILEAQVQQKGVLPLAMTALAHDPDKQQDREQLFDCAAAVRSDLAQEFVFLV